MEESVALSPEIKGLLDTIRKQAKQYQLAFQSLDDEHRILASQRDYFVDSLNQIRREFEETSRGISEIFKASLDSFQSKFEKVGDLYGRLDGIKETEAAVNEMSSSLSLLRIQMEEYISNTKDNTAEFLANTAQEFKFKFEKELEDLAHKFEVRITLKLKQSEGKMQGLEQNMKGLTDQSGKVISQMNSDLEEIKDTLKKQKLSVFDAPQQPVTPFQVGRGTAFDDTLENNKKFDQLFRIVGDMRNNIDKLEQEAISHHLELSRAPDDSKFEHELIAIKKELTELAGAFYGIESRYKLGFGLTIAAVVIGIISIAIAFL
ncbi:MAG: hypothetical protein QG635_1332 [Bacteroidota bacterium]|nr:hypothetical protein [Bacteroidota bacterium]